MTVESFHKTSVDLSTRIHGQSWYENGVRRADNARRLDCIRHIEHAKIAAEFNVDRSTVSKWFGKGEIPRGRIDDFDKAAFGKRGIFANVEYELQSTDVVDIYGWVEVLREMQNCKTWETRKKTIEPDECFMLLNACGYGKVGSWICDEWSFALTGSGSVAELLRCGEELIVTTMKSNPFEYDLTVIDHPFTLAKLVADWRDDLDVAKKHVKSLLETEK